MVEAEEEGVKELEDRLTVCARNVVTMHPMCEGSHAFLLDALSVEWP